MKTKESKNLGAPNASNKIKDSLLSVLKNAGFKPEETQDSLSIIMDKIKSNASVRTGITDFTS